MPSLHVFTVISPWTSIACEAFISIFINTWFSCPALHIVSGMLPGSLFRIALYLSSFQMMLRVLSIPALMSAVLNSDSSIREKVFMSWTIFLTRSAPSSDSLIMLSMSPMRKSSLIDFFCFVNSSIISLSSGSPLFETFPIASDCAFTKSVILIVYFRREFRLLIMKPMGLFISWATPAASWPIEAIFSCCNILDWADFSSLYADSSCPVITLSSSLAVCNSLVRSITRCSSSSLSMRMDSSAFFRSAMSWSIPST